MAHSVIAEPTRMQRQTVLASDSSCMLLCARAEKSKMIDGRKTLPQQQLKDTLPEWSKGVDSSSTSASCVRSNPTGVIINFSEFQLDAMC